MSRMIPANVLGFCKVRLWVIFTPFLITDLNFLIFHNAHVSLTLKMQRKRGAGLGVRKSSNPALPLICDLGQILFLLGFDIFICNMSHLLSTQEGP